MSARADANDDLWHVQLENGELRVMSLDELDAAFNADLIGVDTYVLQQGTRTWAKLGRVAGLEAPPVAVSAPSAPFSTAPLAADIAVDEDDFAPLRPRKKRGLALAVAVIALAGGLGFGATRFPWRAPVPATASIVAPALAATTAPKIDAPLVPVAASVAAAVTLTDEQKRALLAADKRLGAKHAKSRAVTPHRGAKRKGEKVFHAGGDKYDPLNSSL